MKTDEGKSKRKSPVYCYAGVEGGQATNFFRWPESQARSDLSSGRLPLILYALSDYFHVRRPQAGFQRDYFQTMSPEPCVV